MKNYVSKGDILSVVAPSGGVVSGAPFILNNLFLIPLATAAAGELVACLAEGVATVAKLSTDDMAVGEVVNWNDTNKEVQEATSDLDGVGHVVEAAGNGITEVKIKLHQPVA